MTISFVQIRRKTLVCSETETQRPIIFDCFYERAYFDNNQFIFISPFKLNLLSELVYVWKPCTFTRLFHNLSNQQQRQPESDTDLLPRIRFRPRRRRCLLSKTDQQRPAFLQRRPACLPACWLLALTLVFLHVSRQRKLTSVARL